MRALIGTPNRMSAVESVAAGIGGQACLLVSGITAARLLGPDGRGTYALAILVPIIVGQLCALGVPQAVAYFLSREAGSASVIARTIIFLFTGQTLVTIALLTIAVSYFVENQAPALSDIVPWLVAVGPSILLQQYGLALLQGAKRFRPFNLMRFVSPFAMAIISVALFLLERSSVLEFIVAWSLVQILTAIATYAAALLSLRDSPRQVGTSASEWPGKLVRFGTKGMVGYVSPLQAFRLDQLVAGFWLSHASLGMYVVAQAFTNLPLLVSQSASMVAYPIIAGKRGTAAAIHLAFRLIGVATLFNLVLLLLLWALLPFLLPFFFGDDFLGAIPVARALLVGAFFFSLRRVVVECARGLGRPEISSVSEVGMYPVLIAAGFFLIPAYGIMGVAVSVALAQFFSFVWSAWFATKLARQDSFPSRNE